MKDVEHQRWQSGDPVVVRGVLRGNPWWAGPLTVVEDTPSLLALYLPAGTPMVGPENPLTPSERQSVTDLNLVETTWRGTNALVLVQPGAAHAVYAMWDSAKGSLECWYVNLQRPLMRTEIGFDSIDQLLDVVVSPDRSQWQWKDEEEFEMAVVVGVFSETEARAIRAEGERAVAMLQSEDSPYSYDWRDWKPPSKWTIPELPSDWQTVPVDTALQ